MAGVTERAVPRAVPTVRARVGVRERDGHGHARRPRQPQDRRDDQRSAPTSIRAACRSTASDPQIMGQAVHKLCDAGRVDHIDINFGCPGGQGDPARRGRGGAGASRAAPSHPARRGLATHRRTACRSRPSSGWGCSTTGSPTSAPAKCAQRRVSRRSHCTPARCSSTTPARRGWDAIGELKQAVGTIPVLGNGDIWEADDAVRDDGRHRLRRRRRSVADASVVRGCSATSSKCCRVAPPRRAVRSAWCST